jgi:hypothetical protein
MSKKPYRPIGATLLIAQITAYILAVVGAALIVMGFKQKQD